MKRILLDFLKIFVTNWLCYNESSNCFLKGKTNNVYSHVSTDIVKLRMFKYLNVDNFNI